jgi:hypothetical protein
MHAGRLCVSPPKRHDWVVWQRCYACCKHRRWQVSSTHQHMAEKLFTHAGRAAYATTRAHLPTHLSWNAKVFLQCKCPKGRDQTIGGWCCAVLFALSVISCDIPTAPPTRYLTCWREQVLTWADPSRTKNGESLQSYGSWSFSWATV